MSGDGQSKLFILEFEGISIQGIKDKNIKKYSFKNKVSIIKAKQINFNKEINILLLVFILILLPSKVSLLSDHYIKMKFNKVGYNQILSDEYRGMLPSKIIKGDEILFMNKNKIVFIDSINTEIILEFNYYLTNFSFMFSNLTTISYIYIYYMFGKNSNMSYMFYNCSNLSTFSYETFKYDNSIREMKGMFFNCLSLKSFYFHSLNTYYNEYYDINISYMFYKFNYFRFKLSLLYK